MFSGDMRERAADMAECIGGMRILAIGAAGSIGSSTVRTLMGFRPAAVHIVDQNENALAELVRQLRSAPEPLQVDDFRTLPLDYGAAATRQLMLAEGPYDRVLNFAAIKHVRSEKDGFSIMQMFDTNIIKQARFMEWLAESSPDADYFSVSTDKAANPVSFMGATKRIMEHVLFDPAYSEGITGTINTARFANVAFSNGSLPQAWQYRLERSEPLACPKDIRRYFVSLEESGHICALASLFAPDRTVAIPDLDPLEHLRPLQEIAEAFLRHCGFEPALYDNEEEAKAAMARDRSKGYWPLLLTPADTGGEKPYEEFVGDGETAIDIGLSALRAVRWAGLRHGGSISELIERMGPVISGTPGAPTPDKEFLKSMIGSIEPGFLTAHRDSALNLDQRA